jgi:hypothetical protein
MSDKENNININNICYIRDIIKIWIGNLNLKWTGDLGRKIKQEFIKEKKKKAPIPTWADSLPYRPKWGFHQRAPFPFRTTLPYSTNPSPRGPIFPFRSHRPTGGPLLQSLVPCAHCSIPARHRRVDPICRTYLLPGDFARIGVTAPASLASTRSLLRGSCWAAPLAHSLTCGPGGIRVIPFPVRAARRAQRRAPRLLGCCGRPVLSS